MNRRTFLATSGAATTGIIGGCLSEVSPGTDPDGGDESPSTTATVPDPRRVTLIETDDLGDHDLTVEVEMLSSRVDQSSPGRLEIRTTNTGERRRLQIQADDDCSLFNRLDCGSQPEGLWLYHAEDLPDERKNHRWEPDKDEGRSGGDYGCQGPIYETGATITNEYEVWDDYVTPGYYPTGTFRFETSFEISETKMTEDSEKLAEPTWGFSIDVTRSE